MGRKVGKVQGQERGCLKLARKRGVTAATAAALRKNSRPLRKTESDLLLDSTPFGGIVGLTDLSFPRRRASLSPTSRG